MRKRQPTDHAKIERIPPTMMLHALRLTMTNCCASQHATGDRLIAESVHEVRQLNMSVCATIAGGHAEVVMVE
jgi:hypothetical protein